MPVPGDIVTPLGVDAVVARCQDAGDEGSAPAQTRPTTAEPPLIDGTETVAPAPAVVGQLTSSGWRIAGPNGKPTTLAPDDIRLLDRIRGATTVAALVADGAGVDRLAHLVASGALLVVPGGHAPPPPPAAAPEVAECDARDRADVPPLVPVATSGRFAAVRERLHRGGRAHGAPTRPVVAAPDSPPKPTAAPVPAPAAAPAPAAPVAAPAVTPAPAPLAAPPAPVVDPVPDGRIPVYAVWHPSIGPLLSLGMLTAAARAHDGGRLDEVFELRRPETAESFLADLARRDGPAILLCSDYVWTIEDNLDAARRGLAVNPELVVVHGGPSSPKYEGDAEQFLDDHGPVAHVLVRGEGEATLCDLLGALAGAGMAIDAHALAAVDGITFRDPASGTTVRTAERERIADLDRLPSPYLTGEFDHIPASAWHVSIALETNRGCPYGCTYCDWGSATLSRIRKFDLDRVAAEIEWMAARGIPSVQLTDANFGIMARDVDVTRLLAAASERDHFPESVIFCPAKNTTKHLSKIIDLLSDASIACVTALGIQTTDPTTLAAVDRTNISVDSYVALAAEHRRRGHALQGELLLGLPEQTYASYRTDLQFMLDHEIQVRTWSVQLLPNSPMNEPGYREAYGLRTDEHDVVVSAASFTEQDRARMFRLRKVDMIFETWGLLRHVLRWVQWDHGILASAVADHVLDVVQDDPLRFPHLAWVLAYFDVEPSPPLGWGAFYDDVERMLVEDFAIPTSSAMDCVFALNQFLMPAPGRTFPASIALPHDYVSYHRSATGDLYVTGHPGRPDRPLSEHPPARFTVEADPLELCSTGLHFYGDSRDEVLQGDFYMASATANELQSALLRILPHTLRRIDPAVIERILAARIPSGHVPADRVPATEPPAAPERREQIPVAVSLRPTRSGPADS